MAKSDRSAIIGTAIGLSIASMIPIIGGIGLIVRACREPIPDPIDQSMVIGGLGSALAGILAICFIKRGERIHNLERRICELETRNQPADQG